MAIKQYEATSTPLFSGPARSQLEETTRGQKRFSSRFVHLLSIVFFSILLFHGMGWAQPNPVHEMSNAVEVLCPQLKGNSSTLTAAEMDVLVRCGEVKIRPEQTFQDLTNDQLIGLDNMTSEETDTMGTLSVEIGGAQQITVARRITVLRQQLSQAVAFNEKDAPKKEPLLFAGPITSLPATETAPTQVSAGTGKWGLYVNGYWGTGDKDVTSNEPGFDYDSWDAVIGTDYRVNDNLFIGAALGYGRYDTDIDNQAGNVDLDGYGFTLYGTYWVQDWYFDLIGTLARRDYETVRNLNYGIPKSWGWEFVNQQFLGNTDASDYDISVGTGYNFARKGWNINPYGQLRYYDSQIDGYTESLADPNTDPGFGLALQLDDQDITSLTTVMGANTSYAISTGIGIVSPYLRLDWTHEFENDARTITARFAEVGPTYNENNQILIPTDKPDRDYFNLGLGVSTVFPRGVMLFVDYATVLDLDDVTSHRIAAGLRYEI